MSRKTLKPTDRRLFEYILENTGGAGNWGHYRYGLISSEWNPEITERLVNGVFDFFSEINIDKDRVSYLKVPGSFELVNGCVQMQKDYHFDAIIAVGSIIKGETKHFDFISQSICNGIAHLNATGPCPIILCLLTDDNYEQALDRSGGKYGNKGYDCAKAAVYMSNLKYLYEDNSPRGKRHLNVKSQRRHAFFSGRHKLKKGGS
jgi:6,7-dimethyl-8-ribityllumazine synthase